MYLDHIRLKNKIQLLIFSATKAFYKSFEIIYHDKIIKIKFTINNCILYDCVVLVVPLAVARAIYNIFSSVHNI